MKKSNKLLALLLVLVLATSCVLFAACGETEPEAKVVRISTTTSVNDSGLMAYLQPYFEKDTGYKWEVASAGTGAAINAAKYGNADVILVHSKSQEEAFVTAGFARKVDGYAAERISFMNNYFVIVGPEADPAGVKSATSAEDAFNKIAALGTVKFISRDDNSGTHTKELDIWDKASKLTGSSVTLKSQDKTYGTTAKTIKVPDATWYVQSGKGMGATLTMANEENAYTITDKATFLSMTKGKTDSLPKLDILMEATANLKNTYSMIAVKADAPFVSSTDGTALAAGTVKVDTAAADVFVNWMTGEHAKALISFYGNSNYGESLFFLQGGYLAA